MLRAASRSPLAHLIARVLVVALVAAAIPVDATASLPVGEVSKLTKSAFGELLAHTGSDPQPYAFTGEPYDPNVGFQYHRARWMDPRVGRFVGMDPWRGISADPPTLHRYLYASASPSTRVDPSGLTDYVGQLMTVAVLATIGAVAAVVVNGVTNWVQGGRFLDGAGGAAAFGAAALPLSVAFPAVGLVLAGLGIAGSGTTAWRVFTSPDSSAAQRGGALFLVGLSLFGAYTSANYASTNGLWVNVGFLRTGGLGGTQTGLMSRGIQVAADRSAGFSEVLATLPRQQQNGVTMAVGVAIDGSGRVRTLIGTSEPRGYIRGPMRDLILPDDMVVRGTGHAEADIVAYSRAEGWRLIAIGATRDICTPCAAEIAGAGGTAATPLAR
jgi:RHS repeat-associated protein